MSCVDVQPWDDTELILGLNNCGKLTGVEKPEYEMTEEDRNKLDTITLNGASDEALFADGKYREVYTKSEVDDVVSESLENVVVYNNDNDIEPRKDITISYNNAIRGRTNGGNTYDIARVVQDNTLALGNNYMGTSIWSFGRPSVITRDGGAATNYVAYQADVEALRSDVDDIITENIQPLKAQVDTNTANIATNMQSIIDLSETTQEGFNTLTDSLSALDERVVVNSQNIGTNTSDIESLRQELTNQEKFRGYYETTAEITAIANPTPGDYAWNVQSGTVWAYNGTTWYDTTVPIPDQSVDAFDGLPLMDGTADAGSTNRYSRGDHRHPSDDSKANVIDLDDYLALTGNAQTNRITGDVWISTGQYLRFTNSGNSSLGQNASTNTTELTGNGVGGINLIAGNGTVKANGKEVVTFEANGDVVFKNNAILGNDCKILGTDNGSTFNLIELSRFGIIDAGSQTHPFNISTSVRPTVQLAGESGAEAHDVAFVQDIADLQAELQDNINTNSAAIQVNANNIAANRSDIDSILADLADTEHFRGYKRTTAEVTAIPNPQSGDYAYNVQTRTVWTYTGSTWADSGNPIPDGAIDRYEGLPLMDGVADAGTVNQYASGTHRHPTDTSRASVADLLDVTSSLSSLNNNYTNYKTENNKNVAELQNNVATLNAGLSTIESRVDVNESDIQVLQGQASDYGTKITNLETGLAETDERVSVNESDIAALRSEVNQADNFKGYFLLTTQITAIAGTPGDFAWNGQTGTVWVYNGTLLTWQDSGEPIPSELIIASDTDPLVDDVADPGTSTEYSRGDHRHPSDPTKLSVSDADSRFVSITGVETITGAKTFTSGLRVGGNGISPLTSGDENLGSIGSRWGIFYGTGVNVTGDIVANNVNIGDTVNDLTTRITTLENTIGTLNALLEDRLNGNS